MQNVSFIGCLGVAVLWFINPFFLGGGGGEVILFFLLIFVLVGSKEVVMANCSFLGCVKVEVLWLEDNKKTRQDKTTW